MESGILQTTILLLEPDKHIAYLLQRNLERRGWPTATTTNANQASTILSLTPPAIVIVEPAADPESDFRLSLQKLPWKVAPAVIYTTFLEDARQLRLGTVSNLKAIFFKPFDIEPVFALCEKLVRAYKLRLMQ
jgi:DNA-binding response OmpR family regulator